MSSFICSKPVPPDRFVGRIKERDRILRFIAHHGESVAIVSEPGAGKTSLLDYLDSAGRDEAQRLSHKRLLFARADAPIVADGFTRARFWGYVFTQIDRAVPFVSGDERFQELYSACRAFATTTALDQLLKHLADANCRLVLLVDELDHLVERCVRADPEFFAGLRSLLKKGDLTLVATSRKSLAWLNLASSVAAGTGSACFNTLREQPLGALSPEDVDEIASAGRERFSLEDMAFVRAASGGYPRLAQGAADVLWEAYDEATADGVTARRKAGVAVLKIAGETLDEIWLNWSPAMRFVFASVAAAHLEAMGEAALWAAPDGSAAAGLREDGAMFRQELDTLENRGLVSSGRVLSIAFLASFAGKLRYRSRSAASWSEWIREEGWQQILSPTRRRTWDIVLRLRGAALETALDSLVLAEALRSRRAAEPVRPAPPADVGMVAFFAAPAPRRVRLFCSYSHADELHLRKLKSHLATLALEHRVETWFDRLIAPGVDWAREIHANLVAAEIVLLLISADFFDSAYYTGVELELAMKRHDLGQARVIPIVVRAVDWGHLPVASLQALPRNAQPISSWTNEDEAWRDVAVGIRGVVEEIAGRGENG